MEILTNILWILFFYLTGFIVAVSILKVINITVISNMPFQSPMGLKFAILSWLFVIPFCVLIFFILIVNTINNILDKIANSKLLKRFDEWIKYG